MSSGKHLHEVSIAIKTNKLALALELAFFLLLLSLSLKQYLSYEIVSDPDPEGYVSYANHLMENWSLPEVHRRLPGYPLFLVVVDTLGPFEMLLDAYYAQFILTGIIIVAMWWLVRSAYGVLAGLIFLSMFSLPNNFFIYFATIAMSDLLRQVFITLCFFLIVRYLDRRISIVNYKYVLLLVLFGAITYLIHPGSQGIIYIFVFSLVLCAYVYGLFTQSRTDYAFDKRLVGKAVVVVVVLFIVVTFSKQLADRGNSVFYENWSGWRVAMCLPPANQDDLAMAIESAKGDISRRMGYSIEYTRPNIFPELGITPIYEAPPFGATSEEWRQEKLARIRAHFGEYMGCMLREILYRHYDIINHYSLFMPDNSFYKPVYRPMDASPASVLFRMTGIDLVRHDSSAEWSDLIGDLFFAIVKILAFYSLLLIGFREAARKHPVLTAAIPLTAIGWIVVVVTIVSLEPRYLLPFSPFIYLAYALAISAIFRSLLKRLLSRQVLQ